MKKIFLFVINVLNIFMLQAQVYRDVNTASGKVWIGGENIILNSSNIINNCKWTDQSLDTASTITASHFINDTLGFALSYKSGTGKYNIIKTTNGGKDWSISREGAYYLTDIHFSSDGSVGLVGGSSGIFKTMDLGENWVYTSMGQGFNAVFALNSNQFWIGGDNSVIKYTDDGGANWSTQSTGYNSVYNVWSIDFLDDQNGFASMIYGKMIKTTNGGQTWMDMGTNSSISATLGDIQFLNKDTGIVVCWSGNLGVTHNGGQTWNIKTTNPFFTGRSTIVNDSIMICVGSNQKLISYDAGLNWQDLTTTMLQTVNKSIILCDGESVVIDQQTITSNQVIEVWYENIYGCDSLVKYTIQFNKPNIQITTSSTKLTAASGQNAYQWFDCDKDSIIVGQTQLNFYPSYSGNFSCIVTKGICKDTSECVSFVYVGLAEKTANKNQVLIYPNPAKEELNLVFNGINSLSNYTVLDIVGKPILSGVIGVNSKLNISNLVSGIYIIQIEMNNEVLYQRIIVQN